CVCLHQTTIVKEVLVVNSIINDPKTVKQNNNFSPKETAVPKKISVREHLEFISRIYGDSRQEATKKKDEMLYLFGLTKRAKDKADSLSDGKQSKLNIAMRLNRNPEIIFLDELTLELDVRARRNLWKTINGLKGKMTIILTTHYLEEADSLADRIGIMHHGKMQVVGTPEEIKKETGENSLEDAFLSFEDEEED